MKDTNPFASLSSSLLARKGHAKPAMRPQGFHVQHGTDPDSLEDLGWNDMGTDPVPTKLVALTPLEVIPVSLVPASLVPPVPLRQQEEIAREFSLLGEPEEDENSVSTPIHHAPVQAVPVANVAIAPPKAPRAAPGSKAKAAFTLRLDGERHLRLRLICAVNHRSAQQVVTQALDEFLARQPSNTQLTQTARN